LVGKYLIPDSSVSLASLCQHVTGNTATVAGWDYILVYLLITLTSQIGCTLSLGKDLFFGFIMYEPIGKYL